MITLSRYRQKFEKNKEMLLDAAQRGAAWGRLEAELMLEAVDNGHRSRPAEWTKGQWSGYVPPGASRYLWEATLDRAAQAAYEAAIQAAQEVKA